MEHEGGWGSWTTPLRIAVREARSSATKFLFVVLAVGVGVGVLTGVRSFSEAFRGMLLSEARTLMAADLLVRSFDFPSDQQVEVMDSLARRGVRRTWITETVSMMSSEKAETPVLVSVKAVDPAVYPFYGEVRLEPAGRLADRLTADSVVVSSDLVIRLEIEPGDRVRLGQEEFGIAGIVRLEPDRMTGSLNVGPRVMMTREGLDRAGLIRTGSRASQRFLFRVPEEGVGIAKVRAELKAVFDGALITDYRETHPRITSGLNRATTFLSLVSLIAMIVGALGVAMAMHSHLQQRMDAIAIMKCIGGRSGQIIQIYLAQTLVLGLAGGLVGVAIGGGVQAMFPFLIERYFQIRPEWSFNVPTALQGLAIAELVTLLFTLPPLLSIREIRPAIIFRREMAEAKRSLRDRMLRARGSVMVGGIIATGIGVIAAWVAGGGLVSALQTSLTFLGGLLVSLAALTAVAWLLLRGLRGFLRRAPWKLPMTLRHGVANLYRPGNHAQAVLVALGIGVMFTLSVYLIQDGLLAEMLRNAPKNMPNVFLVNVTDRERDGLTELIERQEGVVSQPEIFASVRAKIAAVDGVPIEQLELRDWARRFRRERSVTWQEKIPVNLEVVSGFWWAPAAPGAAPEAKLCVAKHVAEVLKVKPGSRIDWTASGRTVEAEVACLHEVQEVRFGPGLDFVFNPGALDGLPATYFGGVRVRPANVAAMQRDTYRAFPSVTVINAAEVLEIVQEVIDQVALVIRFVALFAILAGVVILASSVAGTRFRRIREAAILKTLGATRARVVSVFSVEFLLLGSVAGLMGGLLASAFSRLLLTQMLDAPFRFEPLPVLVATVATAVIASLAGWVASFRILGQKPLEVLRNE